jgi:hypothetical protein
VKIIVKYPRLLCNPKIYKQVPTNPPMDHFLNGGIDKTSADPTRRKVPWVRELPNVQNTKICYGGVGLDSVLLTEGITLRDLGVSSLIIIRNPRPAIYATDPEPEKHVSYYRPIYTSPHSLFKTSILYCYYYYYYYYYLLQLGFHPVALLPFVLLALLISSFI